jgi:hypothetical protein
MAGLATAVSDTGTVDSSPAGSLASRGNLSATVMNAPGSVDFLAPHPGP